MKIVKAKIQKWGNGLGIRVSGLLRDVPHFEENTPIEVEIYDDGFKVKKISHTSPMLPFSEAELLENMTPHNAHQELIASPMHGEF